MRFRDRLRDVKSFFFTFGIATALCALFGAVWTFYPDLISPLVQGPVRIDVIEYILCISPVICAGFLHGYRKDLLSRREKLDYAAFYLQLYAVCGIIMGVCFWDNIIIVYRVLGPEHLNLSAQMEIQFIFVWFLDISTYRFFTLIYLVVGFLGILYVRKRSSYVALLLFWIYIFSSLVFGYLFGLSITPNGFFTNEIAVYSLLAVFLGGIFGGIFILMKKRWEKEFL